MTTLPVFEIFSLTCVGMADWLSEGSGFGHTPDLLKKHEESLCQLSVIPGSKAKGIPRFGYI